MEEKLFSFKQKSKDFVVSEELPFNLSGDWDVFFVYFEKRNLNTMDVVDHLCKALNISRLTLWIAWLKDKKAITRQRICIYKSALKKIWWEKIFVEALSEVAKVLKINRHTDPIWMTTPIKNTFYIRLIANKKLSVKEKETSNKKIVSLFNKWFPNLFGSQRFGINGSNPKQGSDILQWIWSVKEKKEIWFKIQSYASKIFNDYLLARAKKWLDITDGDILEIEDKKNYKKKQYWVYDAKSGKVKLFDDNKKEDIFFRFPQNFTKEISFNPEVMKLTWPIVWYNLLLAPKETLAWKREKSFLDLNKISEKSLKLCMNYKIFGLRRPLWVFPENVHESFDHDDILLNFTLPSGSYASIMINQLEKTVWVDVQD